MLLLIDNYDSFTYNLAQYLGELGVDPVVCRNDQLSVDEVESMAPRGIVISPGPCTPDQAGISVELVRRLSSHVPMLGVCLGHQAIGQAYGGRVIRAPEIMHGKTSQVFHREAGILKGLPSPFEATRYHSLIVEETSLPECLEVTAWTEHPYRLIMAMRHRQFPVHGVQFHPESILTCVGKNLLAEFLRTAGISPRSAATPQRSG